MSKNLKNDQTLMVFLVYTLIRAKPFFDIDGITGYGVLRPEIKNQKDFCIKINICTQRKLLNFENWTHGEPQQLAKIRVFKVDYFILPLFLVPNLKSVAQNEWKKHPYIFFVTLGSKIKKFDGKNWEKTEKFQKPKSCRQ